VNCPTCAIPAYRLSGGYKHISGVDRIRYFECRNDDCETVKFSVIGHVVKIMIDEPGLTFKTKREAFKVLRLTIRDDREWFDGITEETKTLVHSVLQNWMLRR